MVQMTPLQRLGQPEDVSKAALFLASDEASFNTSAELVVDGGYSVQYSKEATPKLFRVASFLIIRISPFYNFSSHDVQL